MTIGNKITATCSVLVVMTVALGTAALVTVNSMHRSQQATVTDAMPGIYYMSNGESVAKELRGHMLMHIAATSDQDMSRFDSEITSLRGDFSAILKDYQKTMSRAEDREAFSRIEPAWERWWATWEPVRTLSRQHKNAEAFAAYQRSVLPVFEELRKAIRNEVEQNKSYGDECTANSARAYSAAQSWVWGNLLLSLVTAGVLGFFVIRGVSSTLRTSVRELDEGAEQVASAASQVASSSQAMAQGASEQASSLEETSASAQEVASMTRQNAANSRAAADGMQRAAQKVREANHTLDEMIASMVQINESSQKISKIIKVIDEIAFQTNILALNAAVEAARAGEAGMGFAVVADEVRNLAQRSAQAAKDTAALIEESVTKSSEGSQKLNSVADAIRGITMEAEKVKTLVDEVTAASSEQSQGMEQITKAFVEMERVTQRNAASSEESASASEELSAQAQNVKDVVLRLRALVDRHVTSSRDKPVRALAQQGAGALHKAFSSHRGAQPRRAEQEIPFDDASFKEI